MKEIVILVMAACFLLLSPACRLLSGDLEVEIRLGLWYAEDDHYVIHLPEGDRESIWLKGSACFTDIAKQKNLPVLACVPGTGICAGGFFPKDYADGILHLCWEQGFLAAVIMGLYRNGIDISHYDIGALQSAIIRRSSGNPWLCDAQMISRRLIWSGSIASYYGIRPQIPVSQLITPGGSFLEGRILVPINPFADTLCFTSGRGKLQQGISWYRLDGMLVVFSLDEGIWTAFSPAGRDAVFGYW